MAAGLKLLDAKELRGYRPLKPRLLDYFNHSLYNVYPVYNRQLAEARRYPLTTRRYM